MLALTSTAFAQTAVNPTGTYEYNGKTMKINGQTFGPYIGTIQIKKIADERIVMSFFICKGEPSYNLGSFVDTLRYINNTAVYTIPDDDPSCKITFRFTRKAVTVKEETSDFNIGCGFGHGVVADGRFKKISSSVPEITDPLTGEEIQ